MNFAGKQISHLVRLYEKSPSCLFEGYLKISLIHHFSNWTIIVNRNYKWTELVEFEENILKYPATGN